MTSFISNGRYSFKTAQVKKIKQEANVKFFTDFITKRIEEIVKKTQEVCDKNWNDKKELKSLNDALDLNIDLLNKLTSGKQKTVTKTNLLSK